MSRTPAAARTHGDPGVPPDMDLITRLVERLRGELDELARVSDVVADAQWRQSPVSVALDWVPDEVLGAFDASDPSVIRALGVAGDPTSSVALDERRLALRGQVHRSERLVRDALVSVRGVRRGLELAMERWEGERA